MGVCQLHAGIHPTPKPEAGTHLGADTPPPGGDAPPPPAVRMVLERNLVSLEARMVRY